MSTTRSPLYFERLRRLAANRPQKRPPIGPLRVDPESQAAAQSLQRLYHDLGLLVFHGVSPRQTRWIGDILNQVVRWGGVGGTTMRLEVVDMRGPAAHAREKALSQTDLFETVDAKRPGLVRPEALLRLAKSRFRDLLDKHIARLSTPLLKVRLRETQVVIPGSPPPKGSIIHTVSGPRILPFDSFATIGIVRGHAHAIGEARFFAAGTGDYVGAVRMDYVISHYNPESRAMETLWGTGDFKRRRFIPEDVRKMKLEEVKHKVLHKLWRLQADVPMAAEEARKEAKEVLDSTEGEVSKGDETLNDRVREDDMDRVD